MVRILLDAICSGNTSLAKNIIEDESFRGVDSQTSRRDGTALFFCCSRGYLDLALLLLGKNANVNAKNKCQATPLHAAADNNHLRIVKLLLAKGANINAQTHRGDTSLHMAAFRGLADVAQCLVEHGADFLLVNDSNVTAAMEASVQGHTEVAQYLNAINDLYGQPKTPFNIVEPCAEDMAHIDPTSFTSINESFSLPRHQNGAYPGPGLQGACAFPLSITQSSDSIDCDYVIKTPHDTSGDAGPNRVTLQMTTPSSITLSSQSYVSSAPSSPTSPMSLDLPSRRNSTHNNEVTTASKMNVSPFAFHMPINASSPSSTIATSTSDPKSHPGNARNCHSLSMTTIEPLSVDTAHNQRKETNSVSDVESQSVIFHPNSPNQPSSHPHQKHLHNIGHHRNCNSYNHPHPPHHHLQQKRLQAVFQPDTLLSNPPTSFQPRSRSSQRPSRFPEENEDESMTIYTPPSHNETNSSSAVQISTEKHNRDVPTIVKGRVSPPRETAKTSLTTHQKQSLFPFQHFENDDEQLNSSNSRLRHDPQTSIHSLRGDGISMSSSSGSFSGDARIVNDDFDILPMDPFINSTQHQQEKSLEKGHRLSLSNTVPGSIPSTTPSGLSPFFHKDTIAPPSPHSFVFQRLPSTPSSIASIDLGDPNQILSSDPSSTKDRHSPSHYLNYPQHSQQQQQQQFGNNKIQRSYSPMNVEQLPVESGACANDSSSIGSTCRPMETSAARRISGAGMGKQADTIRDLVFTSTMSSDECDNRKVYQTDFLQQRGNGIGNHNISPSNGGNLFFKTNFSNRFNADGTINQMPTRLNDLSAVRTNRGGTGVNCLNIPVGST